MRSISKTYNIYKFEELPDNIKSKVLDDFKDVKLQLIDGALDPIILDFINDMKSKHIEIDFNAVGFNLYHPNRVDEVFIKLGFIDTPNYIKSSRGLDLPSYNKLIKYYEDHDLSLSHFISGNEDFTHTNVIQSGDDIFLFDIDFTSDEVNEISFLLDALKKDLIDDIKWFEYDLIKKIRSHYNKITSDEAILDEIKSNNYEFYEDGAVYYSNN
jgi:hypothetical protein